jgi:hypothetical protein
MSRIHSINFVSDFEIHFLKKYTNIRRLVLDWILEKYGGNIWTGCIWLRIGTSGGLLLTR